MLIVYYLQREKIKLRDAWTSSECDQCRSREPQDHLLSPGRRRRRRSQTEERSGNREGDRHQGGGNQQWRNVEVLH